MEQHVWDAQALQRDLIAKIGIKNVLRILFQESLLYVKIPVICV